MTARYGYLVVSIVAAVLLPTPLAIGQETGGAGPVSGDLVADTDVSENAPASTSEGPEAQSGEKAEAAVSESMLTGVEVSGYWRHTRDDGSEWRLVVRDPTGELLRVGRVAVEETLARPEDPKPAGAELVPRSSLLVDISRPRSASGPDTVVLRSTGTALVRNLGLDRWMGRLGLSDVVTVSASPDLQALDLALGVETALPPVLRFGSDQWAHYLTASVQLERLSPRDEESEMAGLGVVRAYWGRAWGWEGREQSSQAREAVANALLEAKQLVGDENLGDPTLIDHVVAAVREVPGWEERLPQAVRLGTLLGTADLGAVRQFLSALHGQLPSGQRWADLRERCLAWEETPEVFLQERLVPVQRHHLLAQVAMDLVRTGASRADAFRDAHARMPSDISRVAVNIAMLVDAVDPTVLAVYRQVVLAEQPVGDISDRWRAVLFRAFRRVPWGPHDRWLKELATYITGSTKVYRPHWRFALEAAVYENWGSDIDPAAILEATLAWRPDAFGSYGVTLSHKRGKEESDRSRRVNWTSLEFSYRF